jgi:hypothetical protein
LKEVSHGGSLLSLHPPRQVQIDVRSLIGVRGFGRPELSMLAGGTLVGDKTE